MLRPLFAIWVLAVAILAGVLYWGVTREHTVVKTKPAPVPPRAAAPSAAKPEATRQEATLAPLPYEEYREIRFESLQDQVDHLLDDFLKTQGVAGEQIMRRAVRLDEKSRSAPDIHEINLQLPPGHNLEAFRNGLARKLVGLGSEVRLSIASPKPEQLAANIDILDQPSHRLLCSLKVESPGKITRPVVKAPPVTQPVPAPIPSAPPLGRAAIVIDDFGTDVRIAEAFLAVPLALTFSVLPHQTHSQEIADTVHARGHEVLLHLPMEPHGYPQVNPGHGALLASMSTDKMLESLQLALAAVPHASGVNNHMGSTFTERAEPMKLVLSEIHRRGLYFLDSFTTPRSTACALADEMRMPCERRHIFLDHEETEDFVQAQVSRLIRSAKLQGNAVAIGHPHACTLQVLKQEAARFQKERVAVVPLRQIVANTR